MNWLLKLIISGLIVFAVIYLFGHLLKENQFGPQSDEGYYFHYAQTINQKGLSGFKELISWFAHDPKAKLHPSPSRAGYILSSVFLFKLFGSSYFVLGVFSACCFAAFLVLNFYYVRKYFGLDTALLTCLFLSSSPLMLGLARRALIDSPLNFLWGTCVWLLFDFLFEGQIVKFVIFIFIFTLSLFFKEGSFILLPFFVLSLFFFLPKNKRLFWPLTAVVCFVPLLLLAGGSILLLGGWDNVYKVMLSLLHIYKHIGEFNPYVARYCTVVWYRYILDFMVLTPVISLLAFGYSFYFLLAGREDTKRKLFLLYGVALYALLNIFQNNQDVRFAINLEMVLSLFAVFGLQSICQFLGASRMNFYIVLAAIVIFFINFKNFIHIFVWANLLDPISFNLLSICQIIP